MASEDAIPAAAVVQDIPALLKRPGVPDSPVVVDGTTAALNRRKDDDRALFDWEDHV